MDKIRTRMFYEVLIVNTLVTMVFIMLQPQHIDTLLGILIVSSSAIIAHFITLTHTRFTNLSFIFMLLLVIFLTVYNLWMPSLMF